MKIFIFVLVAVLTALMGEVIRRAIQQLLR